MRSLRIAVPAIVCGVALSGCSALSGGMYDTPLPGGPDVGGDPLTMTVEFDDVLDLVPQSNVKVDNVNVGKVTKIGLAEDGRTAEVTVAVNRKVELPAGTTARLQQTSLLGEKYVAFVRPEEPVAGAALADGDTIPVGDTSQAAQVEEVLGALSMVLNGGGIEQFQEISRELQAVSDGRPDEIKAFLQNMDEFVSGLDERKEAITSALDSLDGLSRTLESDKDKITRALDDLSPGMQVVADQREQLVDMLESLDRLSAVSVRTLNASQKDIVADLKALDPVINQLAKAGSNLPKSLEILLTYPFPDSVLGAIKGDYMNVFLTTNFRTAGGTWAQPGSPGAQASALSWPTAAVVDDDAPPTMLPPTSSPAPGVTTPTISVPTTEPTPAAPSQSPTPGPSDPSPEPTPVAEATTSTPPSTEPTTGGEQ